MALFSKAERPPRVRRIVDGVIYDTAHADCVASHTKRRTAGTLKYFSQEMLYRSKQGNWFLVLGQRLAADQPPEVFIQPATREQVCAWLGEYNEIDLVEL